MAHDSIPLNLESAIELAVLENSDITIAEYQVKSTEFALKEVKGHVLPKLYLNANYNINRQVIFLPDGFGMGGTATELRSDNDYIFQLEKQQNCILLWPCALDRCALKIDHLQNGSRIAI